MERDSRQGCGAVHELASPLYKGTNEEKHNPTGGTAMEQMGGYIRQNLSDGGKTETF